MGGVGGAEGEESGACVASDGVTGVGETVVCAAPALAAGVLLMLPDVVGVGTAGSEFPAAEWTEVLLSALARAPRRRPLREGPLPLPKFTVLDVDAIVNSLLHHTQDVPRCRLEFHRIQESGRLILSQMWMRKVVALVIAVRELDSACENLNSEKPRVVRPRERKERDRTRTDPLWG